VSDSNLELLGRIAATVEAHGDKLDRMEKKLDQQHATPCSHLMETRASLRTAWIAVTFSAGLAMYLARVIL